MTASGAFDWNWWMYSDAGLLARIAIGVTLFAALAAWDLSRHGRQARRWREYAFLLVTAAAGIAYGAVNDSITSAISWEYFYYGKGLSEELGPRTPPDRAALQRGAIIVGVKAAGSAGLLAGAILLVANNPSRKRPQRRPLTYRRLLALLPVVLLAAVAGAVVLGCVGYLGGLPWVPEDVCLAAKEGLIRPQRFQCVLGVHLGGYVGGLVGLGWALWKVRSQRRRDEAQAAEGG